MFYIELHNVQSLTERHLKHFEHLSFDSKKKNAFVNFLNYYRNDFLIGAPNQHLVLIERFYQCMITSLQKTKFHKHCDFETMWLTNIFKKAKEQEKEKKKGKKEKEMIIDDVQFKLDWPESLMTMRNEILKNLRSNAQKNVTWNAFNNLAPPWKELLEAQAKSFSLPLSECNHLVKYKSKTSAFWEQDCLTLRASQIDQSFRRNLVEMYQICEQQFNYEKFSQKSNQGWNAYELCKSVAPRICPYCNRNYTPVIADKNTKLYRPELDHFIPKSLYPMFAISFYNLIPSCHSCNHSKLDYDVIEKDSSGRLSFRLRHPHLKEDDVSNLPIFSLKSTQALVDQLINYDSIPNVPIAVEPGLDTRLLNNLERFRLSLKDNGKQVGFYHHHDKELSDKLRLLHHYPKAVLEQLSTLLNKELKQEIGNDAFLSLQTLLLEQVMPAEYKNESLGKLKEDCLKDIVQHWHTTHESDS